MSNKKFKNRYEKLELDVFIALIAKIEQSDQMSKHMDCKAVTVNLFDYTELVYHDERLKFLDNNGYHYSVYSDCELTDLIDILSAD